VSFFFGLDSLSKFVGSVFNCSFPFFVFFFGSLFSGNLISMGFLRGFDSYISIFSVLLGNSFSFFGSSVGNLSFLDLTKLSGDFLLGFTCSNTSIEGILVGSCLGFS